MTKAFRHLTLQTCVYSGFYQHFGSDTDYSSKMYSNGVSEVVLGKAIKQLNLPRDELVIMTKARPLTSLCGTS